jgi:hypothetical protein
MLLPIFLHCKTWPRFFALLARTQIIQSPWQAPLLLATKHPFPASRCKAPYAYFCVSKDLAVAAITFVLYARTGASWWLFAALWLRRIFPMLGYLYSPCWGARIYNAAHTYVLPSVLALFALVSRSETLLPIALIWINHIGVDRLLGYGLKYSNGFGWTHLGRLGKQRESIQASP